MPKKIKMTLSLKSIDSAIQQLNDYKSSLERKCEQFCVELLAIGVFEANQRIAESPLGKYVTISTDLEPERMGCRAIMIATGGEITSDGGSTVLPLMMVEFGSGIHNNQIPNPNADKFGMGVGTYPGQTHAFDDGGWYYLGDDGEWHHSYGTKATMPMYNADIEMITKIKSVAKSVFKS